MKALVTGATGFVGRALMSKLRAPVVLTRNVAGARKQFSDQVKVFSWDPNGSVANSSAFDGVDTIFHLAGESVAEGRWNATKKQKIYDSRILGTKNLVQSIENLTSRPSTLVCASAIGLYGSRGEEILDESASAADDFLAKVCVDWEAEAMKAKALGLRVVTVRIGIVLGRGGGALSKMLLPFKLGAGGRLGSGKQWMSWIHLEDLVNLLIFVAQSPNAEGPFNGTAPNPVTNNEFTKTLGSVLKRPTIFPVPAFGLKLAVGEFSKVLLASQNVIPKAGQDAGFEFKYPNLKEALSSIVS